MHTASNPNAPILTRPPGRGPASAPDELPLHPAIYELEFYLGVTPPHQWLDELRYIARYWSLEPAELLRLLVNAALDSDPRSTYRVADPCSRSTRVA